MVAGPGVCASVRVLDLAGSTVLLTGASGGIGGAIAVALDRARARLVLSGRRTDALEELRSQLGDRPEIATADLSDGPAASRLAERAGAVDVLVANAALPSSGALTDFTPEQLDRALDVNLRAPIQLSRELVPGMVERGRGHLVFISSLSGKVASTRSTVYSATKFGLRGFASGLREDLHGTGVGVTVVFPGFVSGAGMFADAGVELPRYVGTCTPEEVAAAVVRGVEENRAELDVAPFGLRAGVFLSSIAPVTAARLQRRLGAERLAEAMAEGQAGKR